MMISSAVGPNRQKLSFDACNGVWQAKVQCLFLAIQATIQAAIDDVSSEMEERDNVLNRVLYKLRTKCVSAVSSPNK